MATEPSTTVAVEGSIHEAEGRRRHWRRLVDRDRSRSDDDGPGSWSRSEIRHRHECHTDWRCVDSDPRIGGHGPRPASVGNPQQAGLASGAQVRRTSPHVERARIHVEDVVTRPATAIRIADADRHREAAGRRWRTREDAARAVKRKPRGQHARRQVELPRRCPTGRAQCLPVRDAYRAGREA